MDNLLLLPQEGSFYFYGSDRSLPGRLRGAVILSSVYEKVLEAEDRLKYIDRNIRLLVMDAFRPVSLQAALFLRATTVWSARHHGRLSPAQVAHRVRKWVRNPAVELNDALHLNGTAVDLVVSDVRTGRPFEGDLARYDSWSRAMEPHIFDKWMCTGSERADQRQLGFAAAREQHVRAACEKVGFISSTSEACQYHMPESHHDPKEVLDLNEFMVEKLPFGMEDDLMERCERLAALPRPDYRLHHRG